MDDLTSVLQRLDKMHLGLSANGSTDEYDQGLMDGIAVARTYVRRAMVEASRRTEAEALEVWPDLEAPADPTGVDCAERYEGVES